MQINEIEKLPSTLQLTAIEEESKTIAYSEEQAIAPAAMVEAAPFAPVWDPQYTNIEETIDELERRINQEKSRYGKLIANRHIYEQWMGPYASNRLVREETIRLLNYDPLFSAESEPLPKPWLYQRPPYYMGGHQPYHPNTNTSGVHYVQRPAQVFAHPELPMTRRGTTSSS